MTIETKNKLFEAWAYCDELDKSDGFMIQYMQDFAGVDFNCVMEFLKKTTDIERSRWYEENQNWFKKYPSISKEEKRKEKYFKENDIVNPDNF